jgi:hypothetical protein
MRSRVSPLRPTPAHWSPYTFPDLCGIPSGLDHSGADAPAQSQNSLRDGVNFRLRGGIGPLKPTPAHSQMSLRDGIDVRLRGGIKIPPAVQAFGPPEKRILFQVRTGRIAVW